MNISIYLINDFCSAVLVVPVTLILEDGQNLKSVLIFLVCSECRVCKSTSSKEINIILRL